MIQNYEIIENRTKILILLTIMFVAAFMDGLDSSIIYVALPEISSYYDIDLSLATWIMTAYLVGIVSLILFFGKVADMSRIRQVFLCGIAIFTISSLACALSPNIELLIVFRFIQGIGASMMAAVLPIMVVRLLPISHHGRGMAAMTAASAISLAAGPVLGGLFVEYVTWHWIFLINIPIGIILFLISLRYVPKAIVKVRGSLPDIPMTVYIFVMFCSLMMLLEVLIGYGVSWTVYAALCAAVLISTALVVLRHKSGKMTEHVLNVKIFRNRDFVLVTLSFILTTMMAGGVMYLLPYYIQNGAEMSSSMNGMLMFISAMFMIVMTVITGKWCDVKGCRTPAAISIVLRVVFTSIFIFMVPEWGIAPLAIALMIMGLSFGISGTSQSTRLAHHASEDTRGDAGSVLMIANYLGSSMGVIVYVAMFSLFTLSSFGISISDLPADVVTVGFNGSAILGLVLSVVALVCTLAVKNHIPKK